MNSFNFNYGCTGLIGCWPRCERSTLNTDSKILVAFIQLLWATDSVLVALPIQNLKIYILNLRK